MAMKLSLSFLSVIWNSDQDRRLTIGFAVSITLHVLVMLIHFTMPEMAAARTPTLDVILVNARHNTVPEKPQALAQANLEGGGNNSEKVRAAALLSSQVNTREGEDLADLVRIEQLAMVKPQREQALTQQNSSVVINEETSNKDKPSAQQPVTGSDAMDATAMMIKLDAEINEKTRNYSQRPRRTQVGASTQEYRFAQYIESWRAKTERIGKLRYPPAARGKLYDSLLMTVSIKKDGSIEKVVIDRPSKYPVLNEAAERIVRLGEPYDPFPPKIARDTDILEITRTWMFTNDKFEVTTQ